MDLMLFFRRPGVVVRLESEIETKKKELDLLVKRKKNLLDKEVYKKSCELDKLVVQAMKLNYNLYNL